MIQWDQVRHFAPYEFGAWEKLDPMLIYALDDLREFVGFPIHINGTLRETSQFADSQHPLGRAADVACAGLSVVDFWLAAERFPAFRGVGVYPFWERPGLHLDTRPGPSRARWWRDASGIYRPVDRRAILEWLAATAPKEATA